MSFFFPFHRNKDSVEEAARRGDLEAVRKLIERDGFRDVEDEIDRPSLLTVACEAGPVDVVRYLLSQRGLYDWPMAFYYAPYAFAAMRGGNLEALAILCEHGLSPDVKEYTKHGDSLIDTAVEERNVDVVRLLLQHDGVIYVDYDEDYEDNSHLSAIERAAHAGDEEFVAFLLQVGVDLGQKSADDYIRKAHYNAFKYQERVRQEAEIESKREEQDRRDREERRKQDKGCVLGCLGGILLTGAVYWAFRQAV